MQNQELKRVRALLTKQTLLIEKNLKKTGPVQTKKIFSCSRLFYLYNKLFMFEVQHQLNFFISLKSAENYNVVELKTRQDLEKIYQQYLSQQQSLFFRSAENNHSLFAIWRFFLGDRLYSEFGLFNDSTLLVGPLDIDLFSLIRRKKQLLEEKNVDLTKFLDEKTNTITEYFQSHLLFILECLYFRNNLESFFVNIPSKNSFKFGSFELLLLYDCLLFSYIEYFITFFSESVTILKNK